MEILTGELLPDYKYTVNGRERSLCYFNVDEIYPNWPIFMKIIIATVARKHKRFASGQEGFRKDVERAFGVLMSRWGLLSSPCILWERGDAANVVKTAINVHNVIVENRRMGYESELWAHGVSAIGR